MPADRYQPRRNARQDRARDTIDTILEAAGRLLSSDGPLAVTTNRIAERAGVSIGSLYQYFPGKDAVLHALIEKEFTRFVDATIAFIEALDPKEVTLEQAVTRLVDRIVEDHGRKSPLYRGLLMSALSFDRLRFTLDNDRRVLTALRTKLVAFLGPVDADDLETSTFVLLHALKGVQLGAAFAGHPVDDRVRAVTIRLVLASLPPRAHDGRSDTPVAPLNAAPEAPTRANAPPHAT